MADTPIKKKSRHSPLGVDSAISRVLDTSKLIVSRDGVRDNEGSRIQHAFELLDQQHTTNATKRAQPYRQFLKRAEKLGGPKLIALCAVALGQSKVASMTDRNRLSLADELAKHVNSYEPEVFGRLVQVYSTQGHRQEQLAAQTQFRSVTQGSFQSSTQDQFQAQLDATTQAQILLKGDVYELTLADARAAIMSDQVRPKIHLTNTYSMETDPVMFVPISRELSSQFAAQRQQVM